METKEILLRYENQRLEFIIVQAMLNSNNDKVIMEIIVKSPIIKVGDTIQLVKNHKKLSGAIVSIDYGTSKVERITQSIIRVDELHPPKTREVLENAYIGEQVSIVLSLNSDLIIKEEINIKSNVITQDNNGLRSTINDKKDEVVVTKKLKDNFELSELGQIYILKLLEKRISLDIEYESVKLNTIKGNLLENTYKDDLFSNINSMRLEHKEKKIESSYRNKQLWLNTWLASVYKGAFVNYKNISLETIRNRYKENENNDKLFLILQEAVLNPIYFELEDYYDKSLTEKNIEESSVYISRFLGFNDYLGRTIIKNTDAFIKEATGFWKRAITFALIGGGVMAITAGLATPAIATSIGALNGLSGAAAYTSGLATLGAGAIATGGFGMAGGTIVILTSGTLLGGFTGIQAAKLASKFTNEMILFSMVKIYNYVDYLNYTIMTIDSREVVNKIKIDFLEFKHVYEYEIMIGKIPFDKNKNSTINFTYTKLVKIN